jgi:hypothetical protein
MTEAQGDYLGCVIVLLGIVPLVVAVHHAGRGNRRRMLGFFVLSIACSIVGVAVVILT